MGSMTMVDRRRLVKMAAATGAVGAVALPARSRPSPRPGPVPPDLSGTWTNASYTMLQRPKELKSLTMTEAEAAAYETPRRALSGQLPSKAGLGQAESEFNDQGDGLARIHGEIRTSWITDPPDGGIPFSKDANARLARATLRTATFDNVEDRDTGERCLTATGGSVPILNSHDTNFIKIVQTAGVVAILLEKNHDVRLVRIGASPWRAGQLNSWMGTSTGRWEDATLVVETAGFRPGLTTMAPLFVSDLTRVTERFALTGPNEMVCAFRIEDPTLFTQVWGGEILFRRSDKQVYEYACHEGNYSLPSILAGGREQEQKQVAAAKK